MIFLLPLVLSIVGTIFFVFSDEISVVGKLIAVTLTGVSILLQFVPALQAHFLVPLAMQLIVAIWVAIFWQIKMR